MSGPPLQPKPAGLTLKERLVWAPSIRLRTSQLADYPAFKENIKGGQRDGSAGHRDDDSSSASATHTIQCGSTRKVVYWVEGGSFGQIATADTIELLRKCADACPQKEKETGFSQFLLPAPIYHKLR
ncbi:hypothetical protein STEG23_007348, partial [Scotinomys teguina]